jgi:TRAP-type C4-dicarboxylate transport system permease small subunit
MKWGRGNSHGASLLPFIRLFLEILRIEVVMEKSDKKNDMMLNRKWSVCGITEHIISLAIPGIITLFMGGFITAEILGRILLNISFQGLVDLVENFVALIAFLSLAAVQADRSHITVDIVPVHLSKAKGGPILDCLLLGLAILTMTCVGTEIIWYAIRAYKTHITTVTLFWPVWPITICMGIGVILMIVRMVLQFKKSLMSGVHWEETKIM